MHATILHAPHGRCPRPLVPNPVAGVPRLAAMRGARPHWVGVGDQRDLIRR